jgi:hypothetical protein
MLGVFGFAQAGIYIASTAGSGAAESQNPTAFVSKENREMAEPHSMQPGAQSTNDGLLDLNNSVFEMRDRETTPAAHVPVKRKQATVGEKSQPRPEVKTETVDTVTVPSWERPEISSAPKPNVAKSEENDSAPKKYTRGPMGGCFYISGNGNKHYVDRGLCN